jgi:NADH:ubiquinone oxidoreductase subunit
MAKISIFGVLTNVQILLRSLVHGKKVGEDSLGNKYYRGKPLRGRTRERRWVIYKNVAEASLVPPEWHGWLHYQTDALPAKDSRYRKPWQKPPQANLTGTAGAYLPPGARGEQRAASTADYTAWQPPE